MILVFIVVIAEILLSTLRIDLSRNYINCIIFYIIILCFYEMQI